MEREKLTEAQYAKYTSGKVEGLRIALSAFIRHTQTKESIDGYVERLSVTKEFVEEIAEERDDLFDSEWYPNGTIEILSDFIQQLSNMGPYENE